MKTILSILAAAALLTAGSVSLAGTSSPAGNGEGKAQVVGFPPNPAQDMYKVSFVAIDGKQILPDDNLHLEPGTYTLTARIPPQTTRTRVAQRMKKWSEDVDFELVVEPNARYRVLVKWLRGSSADTPYELVVDQVR